MYALSLSPITTVDLMPFARYTTLNSTDSEVNRQRMNCWKKPTYYYSVLELMTCDPTMINQQTLALAEFLELHHRTIADQEAADESLTFAYVRRAEN
jgi:hypothetical protein